MLLTVFRTTRLIDRKHRLICRDSEFFRICDGVVHIQGAGSHFIPEKPGGELFKPLVGRGMSGQKPENAGEGTEKTDTQEQLGEGERGTFMHDDYLMTESVNKSICLENCG